MFVGFIAVVVILLIIVGLMSTGALSSGSNADYLTEAKKVQALLSNVEGEAKFYSIEGDYSFKNLDMDYFTRVRFAPSNMVTANPGMSSADWEGWPTSADGGFPDPYTGPYLKIGGYAGDQIRLVVAPINNGQHAGVFILKQKVNTLDPDYVKILETTLAADPEYIGG